jgi:hypothetical protein
MKANVGTTEKVIRIILGIVIIGAGVVYQSWWGAVGAIPLVTALIGYCPAWSMFGVNTCKAVQN